MPRDESIFCGCLPRCCITLHQNETLVLTGCADKEIYHGPSLCICRPLPCYTWEVENKYELFINEYVLVRNTLDPTEDRFVYGPRMVELSSAWEFIQNPEYNNYFRAKNLQLIDEDAAFPESYNPVCKTIVLDSDEYIITADKKGIKTIVKGPKAFMPTFGDVWGEKKKCVSIPINKYIVIHNSNSSTEPVGQKRGPLQYFPESFETVQVNPAVRDGISNLNDKYLYDCLHVNSDTGYHVQRTDGQVVLLSEPQFYMPKVGEVILRKVRKIMLLQTDFCILKAPDGRVQVVNGLKPEQRSFFMKPFHEFVYFFADHENNQRSEAEGDLQKNGLRFILSTLPQYLSHNFMIRTSDNVAMNLDLRISYQIHDLHLFCANPIQFSNYMKFYVQDEFLDRFARVNLREYMTSFTAQAIASIDVVNAYFESFGITIIDIQILSFSFVEKRISEMLDLDIHTNVTKQNILRAVQNDALIQEQSNEVMRKQKDLDIAMTVKNNEVELQKKILQNDIRVKEMEIQIMEEHKRTDLLTVRRENELMEYEFKGRAKGHNLREFMAGIDEKLSAEQKLDIWKREMDLEQATILYTSTRSVNICPPGADLKVFNIGDGEQALREGKGVSGKGLAKGTASDVAKHNFVSDHERRVNQRKSDAEKHVSGQSTKNYGAGSWKPSEADMNPTLPSPPILFSELDE